MTHWSWKVNVKEDFRMWIKQNHNKWNRYLIIFHYFFKGKQTEYGHGSLMSFTYSNRCKATWRKTTWKYPAVLLLRFFQAHPFLRCGFQTINLVNFNDFFLIQAFFYNSFTSNNLGLPAQFSNYCTTKDRSKQSSSLFIYIRCNRVNCKALSKNPSQFSARSIHLERLWIFRRLQHLPPWE